MEPTLAEMAATRVSCAPRNQGDKPLLESKQASARFYFEKLMPETDWLLKDIQSGKDSLMSLSDEHWVA